MTEAIVNRRILLIDDVTSIHDDFRKILCARRDDDGLEGLERALFGDGPSSQPANFELDTACQGREGLAKVEAALAAGRPYAMAFVDVRMPPGWDGLETVERLWQVDPQLQVVICTAYSDHPWAEFLARLDVKDRLLVLKKPFDIIEVSQLAAALTSRWSLAQQATAQAAQLRDNVQELEAAGRRLQESNLELRGFAHTVSRDLRSPLIVMNSFSDLLEEALADSAQGKVRHYLDRIRAGAGQSEALVEGLIRLAGIDSAETILEPVDLGTLARQILARLQAQDPSRTVSVALDCDDLVQSDARLLSIVVGELLENAWKFTSRTPSARIVFGQRVEGADVTFFVADNGAGFDPALAGRLFKGFQRLHHASEFPGAGVGLCTVRRALERLGGRVWAEANSEGGATFCFTLPGCRDRSVASRRMEEVLE